MSDFQQSNNFKYSEWIITDNDESVYSLNSASQTLDQSSLMNDLEESAALLHNNSTSNASHASGGSSGMNKPLTAETLRILSKINIENLSSNSKFDLLFNDVSMLKASAVQGLLKTTNFRFLAWMIFLECIPMSKDKWAESIKKNRDFFNTIREEICCDPHVVTATSSNANADTSFLDDLSSDHPLSQEKSSTWNRYFWHNELKSVIIQDVNRINRHSEYFSHESTQEKIVNLLFIYVQLTKSEYRQGMHEILTCIMFVLHEEYTTLSNLSETNGLIKSISNLEYLENDTFTIFRALMNSIHIWFGASGIVSNNLTTTSCNALSPTSNIMRPGRRLSCSAEKYKSSLSDNPKLFQGHNDQTESTIMHNINYITRVVLKNNDIEIYNHLNAIEVSLHPFGIRWLRLLFLRELEFPQCLILWDAIFATDNKEFSLCNYIFVALLTLIRDEILKMDNSSCMRLLMQPQLQINSLDVLKTALYLQNPAIYTRPLCMEIANNYDIDRGLNLFHSQFDSNLKSKSVHSMLSESSNKDKNNNYNNKPTSQPSISNRPKTKSFSHNDFDLNKAIKKLEKENPKNCKSFDMKLISMQSMYHNVDLVTHSYIEKIQELQDENINLKNKLAEMHEYASMCSMKINANIILLQEEINVQLNDSNLNQDSIFRALAGLKQVRDQLNPQFQYDQETVSEHEFKSRQDVKE
jgi:TBC1 domain family protein 5